MADRGTYVDIFFRNGLKEFEVLPPPDVWDNIKPVLRKRQKSMNLLRFAAFAAILVSLSAVSYWLTNEISGDFNGTAISLNQDVIPRGSYTAKNQPYTAPIIKVQSDNTYISSPDLVNESISDKQVYFKMSSAGLFSTVLKESKLQRPAEPVIAMSDLTGNSGPEAIKALNLTGINPVSADSENGVNRWTISAMASPNYYSNVSFGNNEASKDLVNSEKPAVSYSGGLSFSYNVNKRISIQSGVYYSSVGQKVTGISSYSGFHSYYDAKSGSQFSIQTSNGVIVATNNDIFLRDNSSARVLTKYSVDYFDPNKADLSYLNNSVIQNFNYLEIPVLFKFKAIESKMDLNFIGGLSYNMLIGNSAFSYVNGEKYVIGKTEGLSPVNFSSSIGLGFEYNFSEKISLNLEPTFRYYLTPLGGLVGSSIHPYSFGVFSGLSYKF
jgi:hypothetical protein